MHNVKGPCHGDFTAHSIRMAQKLSQINHLREMPELEISKFNE